MKVLFLHGYLQNGKVFSEKSSGIRKLLKKQGFECEYLDGPVSLARTDLPFQMDDDKWAAAVELGVNRAWFQHSEISKELDLTETIKYVSDYIKENGPFRAIVGFSQGAAVATLVTNRITELVPGHAEFDSSLIISGYAFTEPKPDSDELQITEKYRDFFQPKKMHTKMIFVYGLSDNAVPAVRSQYLRDLYASVMEVKTFEHPGGHMCPNKKEVIRPIAEEMAAASSSDN